MGDDLQDISDALIANSSVKWGMGGGAATSIFGSLSNNDLLVITGILTTGLGFLVNLVFSTNETNELKKLLLFRRNYWKHK